MKTKLFAILAMVMWGLVLWPLSANADLITIEIEAIVDRVSDDGNFLEGQISPGDLITGFYIYESTTPDSSPSVTIGRYEHSTPPHGIFLNVGGFNFETDTSNVDFCIDIINNSISGGLHDGYGLLSYNNLPLYNGVLVDTISWWLEDSSATALSSDELPTTAPVLEDWKSYFLIIRGSGHPTFDIWAHVTSAIPEPVSIILFGMGGLLIRKRR